MWLTSWKNLTKENNVCVLPAFDSVHFCVVMIKSNLFSHCTWQVLSYINHYRINCIANETTKKYFFSSPA